MKTIYGVPRRDIAGIKQYSFTKCCTLYPLTVSM